ncbi:hypothetical protein GDO81_022996 [Engystomops pustulosus]|uniref:Ig-like domain-containing protein n=2 Tax=Engystomops pustulosus TaxID=76066 RepID=A0AAV6ZLK5_ENGPU|nr:hypothetical protein GDO81_022996 [Engystomops pustulosus]
MSNELKITVVELVGRTFLTTDIKDLVLMPGDNITFTCSLTQGNGSHFFWIHNEQNLKQDTATYEFRGGGKVLHVNSAQPDHEGSYQCAVKKYSLSGRPLVSKSDIWTLKISGESGSYLTLFVVVLVVALILLIAIFIIVMNLYQNKICKTHFLPGKPQNARVTMETIGDELVALDNEENFQRITSSQN